MKTTPPKWVSEWHRKAECEGMPEDVLNRMVMLRRQMLLHAYIYYSLGDNIWSDHEWDKRSRELHQLQQEHGWNIGFYDDIFRKWEGQSGFWLPTNSGCDENVNRVAHRILGYDKKLRDEGGLSTPCGHVPRTVALDEKKT